MADPASEPRSEAQSEALCAFGEQAARRFGQGRAPLLAFAPGRVNLMGAHLDYNGGPVMPTAIDRGTWIAAVPRAGRSIRMASSVDGREYEGDLDDLPDRAVGAWFDYPLGVVRALTARGLPLEGVDLLFGGDLPIGAGLSSSASICVGTAFALARSFDFELEPPDQVRVALEAERGFVGVRCGIMDPFAVAHGRAGHLLWVDCKDESFEHVPLDPARVTIAVADSGVRRELAQGAFNERVEQCRRAFLALRRHVADATCLRDIPPSVLASERRHLAAIDARRAQHVVDEVARAFRARRSLDAGDLADFGRCMTESHRSLRTLYEVSTPELDCLVAAAVETPGVLGSRLTGAGFGGCTVVLLEAGAEDALRENLERAYGDRFGRRPQVQLFRGSPGPREL